MLRRVVSNRRMFRFGAVARPYSTAGYGNVTTSQQNPDQPPLDVEDPQELSATPPPQFEKPAPPSKADAEYQAVQKKENAEHDQKVKQQRKDLNKGDQDAIRQYSAGCD
eukprot:Phypoly_transcript_22911.p1 GENE.Phypoly_transcript_22911~~Phypoly_transcript_22911.p1  ORF type:complete len:109 (+),score=21.79 Phypoly_transcript_22911:107-433(+)